MNIVFYVIGLATSPLGFLFLVLALVTFCGKGPVWPSEGIW
jgi:hypothetical protein